MDTRPWSSPSCNSEQEIGSDGAGYGGAVVCNQKTNTGGMELLRDALEGSNAMGIRVSRVGTWRRWKEEFEDCNAMVIRVSREGIRVSRVGTLR